MRTAADVTEKMGEPDYRLRFNHDDPADKSVYINRMPLASWKELEVATPTGLLDTLPIGTKLFSYTFVGQWDAINPWTEQLLVCVDDSGQVVGWMYAKSLVGIENKASLR